MSRTYRISIAEKVQRHVVVKDGVQTPLELLPVLPRERMVQLLAQELDKSYQDHDGVLTREEDGVRIEIDTRQGTVTATIEEAGQISIEERKQIFVEEEDKEAGRKRESQKLAQSLQLRADRQESELQQAVTEKLKSKLHDLQLELDQAINRATAAALKEKAGQLGEIENIAEDSDGSLTIKIRL